MRFRGAPPETPARGGLPSAKGGQALWTPPGSGSFDGVDDLDRNDDVHLAGLDGRGPRPR
jgi:hypothetical protein